MNDFLIALGANLPAGGSPPMATIRAALRQLAQPDITLVAVSALYQTPCFPPGAGPDYVNAAACLRSGLDPQALLGRLHRIEADFGRERKERWGMRTLDLDLLACGDTILPNRDVYDHWLGLPAREQTTATPSELVLPHPRLQDRAFVLVPLRDIAADWVHPVFNKTVDRMCAALSPEELAEIVMLGHNIDLSSGGSTDI